MFPGTGFYGIRQILLAYANLPSFLPLPIAIQHGWQRFAHAFEASANPPEIWVWSPRLAAELEKFYPVNRIRVVGSFFCYLMATIKDTLPKKVKKGSVCIPPHSSHFARTGYSVDEFARTLYALGDDFKPITVMLYYLDMDEQTVSTYEKFGFKVVSNGTLSDVNFLNNFVINVYDKKHCIFSDLGSGVFFAADLGLNLVRINIQSTVVNLGNKHITEKMISEVSNFDEAFLLAMNGNSISEELGTRHMLSPKELRCAILKNYFTWNFAHAFGRRIGGAVLRRMGLRRNTSHV
jgi:hypothetical protein